MIAKMYKYSFLIHHGQYDAFLLALRNTGVVHINEKAEGVLDDAQLAKNLKEQEQINAAIKFLKGRKIEDIERNKEANSDGLKVLENLKSIQQSSEELSHQLQRIKKEIALLAPWGEFDWGIINNLKAAGRFIHFFSCNQNRFESNWTEQFNAIEIGRSGSSIFFIAITNSEKTPDIAADILKLPTKTLQKLQQDKKKTESDISLTNTELNELSINGIEALSRLSEEIQNDFDLRNVQLNTNKQADDRLMILEGWVPAAKEEALNSILNEKAIVHVRDSAQKEDNVPILLKNNKFSRLFELIGEMYSLPNHKELDLTPYYAPFYAIFFGFCLGDAGYGLLFLIIGIVMSFIGKREHKPIMAMLSILGFSTIIFGLIGGTAFGMNLYEMDIEPYNSISKHFGEGMDINNYLFYFSLILGAIQIVFGMSIKAANEIIQLGIKYALSTIGWIILIIGVVSIVISKKLGLDEVSANYLFYGVGGICGFLILFMNNPDKNPLINLGSGLYGVYNMATGLLGDILSYIRLFALGISSAILGNVFNSLAFDLSPDIPVVKIIVIVIILLFGHGINLFMATLGSFVHPMRLTLVEFYKNSGFTGGGIKYSPFKKR